MLPRALRILHGLATEIARRGHSIGCVRPRLDGYERANWKGSEDGQFVVTIAGHDLKLRIAEKGVGLRGPWEAHKKRREDDRAAMRFDRWDVGRIEAFDRGATGQLGISILTYGSRQTSWGDRKRWALEDRLPQVLRELETLAAEAEQRRIAREQQQAERQAAWEAAMERAKVHATEAYHVDVLKRRIAAWNDAEQTRAYCDAVLARHGAAAESDPETMRWIEFARAHADRLQELPRMLEDPELRHEDLKPYLGGWSPYGPG